MPVTIVIDVLDECRADRRHELLGTLDIIMERSDQLVKAFVSSRDDLDIVLRLQKHTNIYLNVDDNKGDIHKHIQAQIQKAETDKRLLKGIASSELAMLVTKSLDMKPGGMYVVLLALQIHKTHKTQVSLGKSTNREPVRQSPYQNWRRSGG